MAPFLDDKGVIKKLPLWVRLAGSLFVDRRQEQSDRRQGTAKWCIEFMFNYLAIEVCYDSFLLWEGSIAQNSPSK